MFCFVLFCSVLFCLPLISCPFPHPLLLFASSPALRPFTRAYLRAIYAYSTRAARKELRIIVIQHLLISSRIIMQYYYRLSIGHYSANLQKISHLANKILIKIGY